ncbi:Asp-tRNA(Asn)/Glu-tRNA(Gln) amidotransferase subunit GatC [Thermodesulfobacteriota bacterium]
MKISKQEVMHVADLARLDLDEDAIDKFARQIGVILEYVETLSKVDTTGVRPTSHAIFLSNAFRKDTEDIHLLSDAALSNAPEKENGSFVVPRIIG